ncbi:MAG: hypothetical protein WCP86_10180, partial [bacterium]
MCSGEFSPHGAICSNDPINHTDPLGLFDSEKAFLIFAIKYPDVFTGFSALNRELKYAGQNRNWFSSYSYTELDGGDQSFTIKGSLSDEDAADAICNAVVNSRGYRWEAYPSDPQKFAGQYSADVKLGIK